MSNGGIIGPANDPINSTTPASTVTTITGDGTYTATGVPAAAQPAMTAEVLIISGGRGGGNSGSITDRDGGDGLGGGGGGVRDPGNRAGHGGNGRIIIAYAGGQRGSGGSYTSSGGWSYHTYNYTGSLTTYTA